MNRFHDQNQTSKQTERKENAFPLLLSNSADLKSQKQPHPAFFFKFTPPQSSIESENSVGGTFHPTQFQPLSFQPLTISTYCIFNLPQFRPNLVFAN